MNPLEKHVTDAVGKANPGAAIPFELILQIITALMGFIGNCPFGGAKRAIKAGSTEATVAAYHAVKKSGYTGNAVDLARELVERGKAASDDEIDEVLQSANSMPMLSKLLMVAVLVLGISASAVAGPFPEAASGPFPLASLKGGDPANLSPAVQVGEPTAPEADDPVLESPAPVSDNRPLLPMYVPSDGSCWICHYFEDLPQDVKDSLPFRIDARVNDDIGSRRTSNGEQYGYPVFHTPANADGNSSYIFHVGADVEALTRRWQSIMGNQTAALAVDDAAPTPYAEVIRGLSLLPEPKVGFVEPGCGADARWCVSAVEKWDCKAIGIEIDPERAAAARRHVAELGLSDRIEIIEGDATTIDVEADVGAVYLYSETLEALKPKLEKLTAFISYRHQVPNLSMSRNGDSYVWRKPVQQAQYTYQPQRAAVWNGQYYYSANPGCDCKMCRSIRAQLNQ